MAALRKANSHSVVICRLIKNNNVPRRKTDSNFNFFQASYLPSAYEVLIRGNIMQCISQNCF